MSLILALIFALAAWVCYNRARQDEVNQFGLGAGFGASLVSVAVNLFTFLAQLQGSAP